MGPIGQPGVGASYRREVQPLLERLLGVGRRARLIGLATGLVGGWVVLAGTALVLFLVDRFLLLPSAGRLAAGLLLAATVLGVLHSGLLRPLLRRMDPEELALKVEARFGGLKNLIISAVQLGREGAVDGRTSPAMVEEVGRQAAECTANLPLSRVVETDRLKRLAPAAATALLLVVGYTAWQPIMVRTWLQRLIRPFDPTLRYPTRTRLELVSGDVVVASGDFAVLVTRAEGVVPESALLRYWQGSGAEGTVVVRADTSDRSLFRTRFGPIEEDTLYRFEAGDAQTERARIRALPRPRLVDLTLQLRWPPYVHLPTPPPQCLREITALRGTLVEVRGRTSIPPLGVRDRPTVQRAHLRLASGRSIPLVVAHDGSISGSFLVRQDDAYSIILEYDYPLPRTSREDQVSARRERITVANRAPVWYRIHALADEAPVVRILQPNPTVDVSPLGRVTVRAEVSDDYGLSRVRLCYTVRHPPPSAVTAPPEISEEGPKGKPVSAEPPEPADISGTPQEATLDRRSFRSVDLPLRPGVRRAILTHFLDIVRLQAHPGDQILYYLVAEDDRHDPPPGDSSPLRYLPRPNRTESDLYEINVVSQQTIQRLLQRRQQSIWDEIYRIYQRERTLHREVEGLRGMLHPVDEAPASQPSTHAGESSKAKGGMRG